MKEQDTSYHYLKVCIDSTTIAKEDTQEKTGLGSQCFVDDETKERFNSLTQAKKKATPLHRTNGSGKGDFLVYLYVDRLDKIKNQTSYYRRPTPYVVPNR